MIEPRIRWVAGGMLRPKQCTSLQLKLWVGTHAYYRVRPFAGSWKLAQWPAWHPAIRFRVRLVYCTVPGTANCYPPVLSTGRPIRTNVDGFAFPGHVICYLFTTWFWAAISISLAWIGRTLYRQCFQGVRCSLPWLLLLNASVWYSTWRRLLTQI